MRPVHRKYVLTIGEEPPAPIVNRELWMEDAVCRGEDPELWFPQREAGYTDSWSAKRQAQAKAICQTCPVMDDCLDMALRQQIGHGVWGGKTPEERHQVLRDRRFA